MAGPLIAEATHAGLKVSALAQLILIVLVLGAGTDYGLFLVFRVREAVRDGMPMREAVVHSLGRVGESITFSAGTVIAALLSLLAASFGIYSNLGIPLAIGIGLMLLAGLTLLPALLAIFGRAVFWPSKLKVGHEPGRVCGPGYPGGSCNGRWPRWPSGWCSSAGCPSRCSATRRAGSAVRPRLRPARIPRRALRRSPRTSRRPTPTRRACCSRCPDPAWQDPNARADGDRSAQGRHRRLQHGQRAAEPDRCAVAARASTRACVPRSDPRPRCRRCRLPG